MFTFILLFTGELVASKNYSHTTKTNANNRLSVNVDEILNSTNEISIILDKTVCYSLEGGQVSDKGNIFIKNLLFNVHNVRKVNGYVIHSGYFNRQQTDLP